MLNHDVFISYSQAADGQFGAMLQHAMERLARSWRQRRALRVFRDLTGLAASPDLWGSIVEAVDGAEWFVLLASPAAAESEWVGREIEHWVATKGTDRLLVVVTDGTWVWDADRGDLDRGRSSAAHPALQGIFRAEPRHMDLSWARTEDDLTLRNARFHEAVAELVAPMHGLTKDELVGEDVRQQRRTMRLVRGAVAVLSVLTLVATGATGVAVASARDAERQRALADEERERAEEHARQADSRRLAALSLDLQSQDGALSQLLAVQAHAIAPTEQARAALASAATYQGSEFLVPSTDGGRVHARLVGHEDRPVAASFSPDGAFVATLDQLGTARLWDVEEPSSPTIISGTTGTDVAVSGSGATVAVATGGQIRLFDLDGQLRGVADVSASRVAPHPDGYVAAGPVGVSVVDDDGRVLAEGQAPGVGMNLPETAFVEASVDGSRVVVSDGIGDVVTLDGDLQEVDRWTPPERRRILNDDLLPATVLALSDDATRVVLPELQVATELDGVAGEVPPPARSIAAVYDLASGELVDRAVARVAWESMAATSAAFVPDTDDVIAASPFGVEAPPALASTAATTGFQPFSPPPAADLVEIAPDGRFLLVGGDDTGAVLAAPEGADAADATGSEGDASTDVSAACQLAGRNLSEAEWTRYLPDRDYEATCSQYDAPHDPDSDPPAHLAGGEDGAGDLASVDFANSTYRLQCEAAETVQLVDGRHDGRGIRATVELQDVIDADMDGDGVDEAVVTLSCQAGNGFYVETALVFDGRAGAALEQVGEPVAGQFVHEVRPGVIVTRDPLPAPDDPLCCPSKYWHTEWLLREGEWVEGEGTPVDAPT